MIQLLHYNSAICLQVGSLYVNHGIILEICKKITPTQKTMFSYFKRNMKKKQKKNEIWILFFCTEDKSILK